MKLIMQHHALARYTSYLITAVISLSIGLMIPLLYSHSSIDRTTEAIESEVPYCVASPQVPASVSFAGQEIDLTRCDLRERMDRELMAFTYMHSSTLLTMKRANRYFPVIEPILKAHGLPDDLKYLAVIESSLNPKAKSPAGAVGLWQFMPATAKEYGLEVNNEVDERYHIEKETEAACRYLKASYERYGNWICVAASYNAGPARISSQLKLQMAEQAVDLWLVEETSRYMFRLLAAKAVVEQPRRYGFLLKKEQLYPPMTYRTDTVRGPIDTLARYAQKHQLSYAQLKEANLWLRSTRLTNRLRRPYVILLPEPESLYYDPKRTRSHNPNWVID